MKNAWLLVVLTLLLLMPAGVAAQEKEHPAHAELRTLKDNLVDAIKKNDVDKLLTYLDEKAWLRLTPEEQKSAMDECGPHVEKLLATKKLLAGAPLHPTSTATTPQRWSTTPRTRRSTAATTTPGCRPRPAPRWRTRSSARSHTVPPNSRIADRDLQ